MIFFEHAFQLTHLAGCDESIGLNHKVIPNFTHLAGCDVAPFFNSGSFEFQTTHLAGATIAPAPAQSPRQFQLTLCGCDENRKDKCSINGISTHTQTGCDAVAQIYIPAYQVHTLRGATNGSKANFWLISTPHPCGVRPATISFVKYC